MTQSARTHGLAIWGLAFGYFAFYVPYVGSIRAVTSGLLPAGDPVSGFRLLPPTVIATALTSLVIITYMDWWRHVGRRRVLGWDILVPSRWTLLSGVGFACVIMTTTLAYTWPGVSILFALIVLRGGVLILAPVVDTLLRRRVRWFSWAALTLSLTALGVAFADVERYRLTPLAAVNVAVYLTGYAVRVPCMTHAAKIRDRAATLRFLVEEQLVALLLIVSVPAAVAIIGRGAIALDLRSGFTLQNGLLIPGLVVGGLYACLAVCGTLIYLDARENTFCVPLNRSSSLLSGVAAAYLLNAIFGQAPPTAFQLTGAALVTVAMLLLSPLHHRRLPFWRRVDDPEQRVMTLTAETPVISTDERGSDGAVCAAEVEPVAGRLARDGRWPS